MDAGKVIASDYVDTLSDFKEFMAAYEIDELCEMTIEANADDIADGSIASFIKECRDAFEARKAAGKDICCICGEPLEGLGNDPWPINLRDDAKCCDSCTMAVIVPARYAEMKRKG